MSVVSNALNEFVMAGSEDVIKGGRVTDGDTKVLSRTNNKRFFPADLKIVEGRTEVGATAGGDKDCFLVV